MKRNVIGLLIVCIIAILASCLSPYTEELKNETGLPSGSTSIEFSYFEKISTGYKLYTTDPKYRTPSGYTLWAYNSDPSGSFTEREVSLSKPTGDSIAGYGVIICSEQHMIEGRMENVFLTVMINNLGQYAVGKVIGAFYIPLEKWRSPGTLKSGSGLTNTIKIEKDTAINNRYNLYFNDNHNSASDFFIDSIEPFCNGVGRNGYIVVISPNDLNGSAVEVYFHE